MNLSQLSDKVLLLKTEQLVFRERDLLVELLLHLQEIDRRRLFSAVGCKSLFAYVEERLGYPADQAYRRISAMKLLKEMPELSSCIQSGRLSLTSISMAQTAFRREKLNMEQKREILLKLEGQSTRQATKLITAHFPAMLHRDQIRAVSPEKLEIRVTVSASMQKKIEILRGLLAHKYPALTVGELFEMTCDEMIENRTKVAAPRKLSRHSCENCGSTYALEIDHRKPKALGGGNEPENLRVLCRNCNQRAAIETFGQDKMDKYIN